MHLFDFRFGPNNGYFVYTPQGWHWQGIPEADVRQYVAEAARSAYPRISRGVDGTYVRVNAAGQCWFHLDGKYPALEQALNTNTAAIEMVALNPYVAGLYVIIYKYGAGYLGRLPAVYKDTVEELICQGLLPFAQQAQRQQAETNSFLLDLLMRR